MKGIDTVVQDNAKNYPLGWRAVDKLKLKNVTQNPRQRDGVECSPEHGDVVGGEGGAENLDGQELILPLRMLPEPWRNERGREEE